MVSQINFRSDVSTRIHITNGKSQREHRCRFRRTFVDRIKLSDRLKLCDVADMTKVAACGSVFTGRSGRVGEISGSFLCDAA